MNNVISKRSISTQATIVSSKVRIEDAYAERVCIADKCGKEVPEGITTMLCVDHLRKAWAAYELIKGTDADTFRAPAKPRTDPHCHDARGFVYFAQVGRYVKIGWTSDVKRRMSKLKASCVYHTFPGTRADEKALHVTFRKYLADGAEYFHPTPVLMKYIKELQTKG